MSNQAVPASVAQSDVYPTGEQEVAGPPLGPVTFFHEDWLWNIFCVILSLLLIQEGQLSVSGKRMCTSTGLLLEDYACPGKVWLDKLTVLDMTLMDWMGHKTSTQSN